MSRIALCLLSSLIALLAGCNKSKQEDPLFKVDEAKVPHPGNVSGTIHLVQKPLKLSIQAPSPAWGLKITEVWGVGEELWVLAELTEKEGMFPQVITEISDSVTIEAPNLEPVYSVIGSTGGWTFDGPTVKLIANRSLIEKGLEAGFPIWPQP